MPFSFVELMIPMCSTVTISFFGIGFKFFFDNLSELFPHKVEIFGVSYSEFVRLYIYSREIYVAIDHQREFRKIT